MDLIEMMRCMLRDPVWWNREAGFDPTKATSHHSRPGLTPLPPASASMVASAVSNSQLPVPPLLVRLYGEVANGEFGPAPLHSLFQRDDGSACWANVPDGWEVSEILPGLRVWLSNQEDEGKREIALPELLWVANDGCQTNWYVFCDGEDFPVVFVKEDEPFLWGGEPLRHDSFAERIALFGGEIAAPTFDGWVTDWVRDFPDEIRARL